MAKKMLPADVLQLVFQRKIDKNSKYSLRAFARDLNLSPGRLSVVLASKVEPGPRFIKRILASSVLDASEKALLNAAVLDRRGFDEQAVGSQLNLHEYDSTELDSIEIHTILALLRTRNCSDNHAWIAARLKLSQKAVDKAIAILLQHNVIVHRNNCYFQKIEALHYEPKKPNPKIAESYQKYLQDSIPNVLNLEKDHTIFGTIVVSLDKEDIPRLRKILHTTFKKIHAISDKSKRTEVYNVSVIEQKMSHSV